MPPKGIFFTSSNPGEATIDPQQGQQAPQRLTITGVSIPANIVSGWSRMNARADSLTGPVLATMNTLVYPWKARTVAIRLVHEENDDVQVIAVGAGDPNAPDQVCVSAGANKFRDTADTARGGDDVIVGDNITTGRMASVKPKPTTPMRSAQITRTP